MIVFAYYYNSFLYEVYFIGLRTMIESGAVFDYVSEDADVE